MKPAHQSFFRGVFLIAGLTVLGFYLSWVMAPPSEEKSYKEILPSQTVSCPDTGLPEPQCPKHGKPILADEPTHPNHPRNIF